MNPMRPTAALLLCVALPACVGVSSTRVPESTRFRSITAPADIAAVYSSKDDHTGGGSGDMMYSMFGTYSFSRTPDSVRFRSRPPADLVCEALSGGSVVATRELVQGRDFRIAGGALHLKASKPKGVAAKDFLKVETRSTVIRLTDSGDAVVTQRHSQAAMAFFVFPAAIMDTDDALFRRIGAP